MSYLTVATSPAEKEFYQVAQKVQVYFEQDIGNRMLNIIPDHWTTLIWATEEWINMQLNRDENSNSIEKILTTISSVFSVLYIHSLGAKFATFDEVAGTSLSDVFIQ